MAVQELRRMRSRFNGIRASGTFVTVDCTGFSPQSVEPDTQFTLTCDFTLENIATSTFEIDVAIAVGGEQVSGEQTFRLDPDETRQASMSTNLTITSEGTASVEVITVAERGIGD